MEFEVFQSAIMELIRFQLSKEFLFPRLVLRRPVLSSLLRAIYFMHRSIGPQVQHAKAGILLDKNTGKDFNVLCEKVFWDKNCNYPVLKGLLFTRPLLF